MKGTSTVVAIALAAFALIASEPAMGTFPGRNGDIAFDAGETEFSSIGTYPNNLNPVGAGTNFEFDPAWTADGQTIAYVRDLASGDQDFQIFWPGCCGDEDVGLDHGIQPTWSPDGARIAFVDAGSIRVIDRDGFNPAALSSMGDTSPNWSPDGTRIAFASNRDGDYEIYAMNADGTAVTKLTDDAVDQRDPAWSPDGTKIAFELGGGLWEMPSGGGAMAALRSGAQNPDWQAVPPSYVRPRGASPLYVSLVPASQACTAPNATHGAPLAFGSCSPPVQTSPLLTVGTPDANLRGANSVGWAVVTTRTGNESTPADEADVKVQLQVTDVRRSADLSDYTGEVQLRLAPTITDRDNSGNIKQATTVVGDYRMSIPCTSTEAANTGGTCAIATTLDTIVAGTIKEGKRAVWELGQVKLFDGGPDEVAGTSGNTLFAVQGVFVP